MIATDAPPTDRILVSETDDELKIVLRVCKRYRPHWMECAKYGTLAVAVVLMTITLIIYPQLPDSAMPNERGPLIIPLWIGLGLFTYAFWIPWYWCRHGVERIRLTANELVIERVHLGIPFRTRIPVLAVNNLQLSNGTNTMWHIGRIDEQAHFVFFDKRYYEGPAISFDNAANFKSYSCANGVAHEEAAYIINRIAQRLNQPWRDETTDPRGT